MSHLDRYVGGNKIVDRVEYFLPCNSLQRTTNYYSLRAAANCRVRAVSMTFSIYGLGLLYCFVD
jgi:hypothetical protein